MSTNKLKNFRLSPETRWLLRQIQQRLGFKSETPALEYSINQLAHSLGIEIDQEQIKQFVEDEQKPEKSNY